MNKLVKAFKHTFIPHEHNGYKPHFFREASVFVMATLAIVLLCISASSNFLIKNGNMTATVLPAVLVDLTNNARVSNNEQILTRNTILDTAARLKAENMASLGYFAHTSPEGLTPWHWFDKVNYYFSYAGENLAINFTESADVENAWLNSPTHKANIMSSHFTEIGIATVDGIYQGRPTTYVVQMFGAPAIAPVKAQAPVTSPKAPVKKQTTTLVKTIPTVASPTKIALAPAVKGESVTEEEEVKLETIADTKEFVAVKNTEVVGNTAEQVPPTQIKYSKWSDKFLFFAPTYVDRIYVILISIVLLALLGMTVIEVRRQHPKNIMYGALLVVIMFSLMYINKTAFAEVLAIL